MENGCGMHRQTDYEQLESLATVEIKNLPLLQGKVQETISLLDDPDSDFYQVINQLSPDITAKFIEYAGSSLHGQTIRSIDHAVRLLGYKQMRQILTTSMLVNHFAASRSHLFHLEKFHKQAQLCAGIALSLGQIVDYSNQAKLFTVALLHNIGKLIIAVYYTQEYDSIVTLKQQKALSSNEAEKRILGLNHAELGALILKKCHLPEDICHAVRLHEQDAIVTDDDDEFLLLLILRKASQLANSFSLPAQEIVPQSLPAQLQTSIEQAWNAHRTLLKDLQHRHGLQHIWQQSIEHGADSIRQQLSALFSFRPV
jgi:HD-like signal output (HDOD) protein